MTPAVSQPEAAEPSTQPKTPALLVPVPPPRGIPKTLRTRDLTLRVKMSSPIVPAISAWIRLDCRRRCCTTPDDQTPDGGRLRLWNRYVDTPFDLSALWPVTATAPDAIPEPMR